jgi:hypothetical protein
MSPGSGVPGHDDLIKKLLQQPRLFREFCRAFLPGLEGFASLEEIEYLDKEHPGSKHRPRRSGDLLIRLRQRDGEVGFLVHIESQSRAEGAMIERAVEYAMRDCIRYGMKVLPVVLLTYAKPAVAVRNELHWDFGELASVRFRCPVVQFSGMDPEPFLRSRNVAALAMTSLMKLTPEEQVRAIVETLAESVRQRLSVEDTDAVMEFIQHYVPLAESQALQIEATMDRMISNEPELAAMPKLVNPFIQIGRIHGRQEGRQEGLVQIASRQVGRKFPKDAGELVPLVGGLDEERLLAFGEALLGMETAEECRGWLERAGAEMRF